MRAVVTILGFVVVFWLYVGAPLSPVEVFGEIRPLHPSNNLPAMAETGKTIVETMVSRKMAAEERKEKALRGEIYGNPEWTRIHVDMVGAFEDLKKNPCDSVLIANYAALVNEYFVYGRLNASNGKLRPVDYDMKDKAERALADSMIDKYIIRSDLSREALQIFSFENEERAACQD